MNRHRCVFDDCVGHIELRTDRGHEHAWCQSCCRALPIWLLLNALDTRAEIQEREEDPKP
jgi:pyruvate/2-oxoacid:ferredoxin oxidoreductase beta subunit